MLKATPSRRYAATVVPCGGPTSSIRPCARCSLATCPGRRHGLIDRWCSRAQRSRIPDFVKAAATIRKHKDRICAAIERQLSNGRYEGLNNKIRTMTRRAYGFHSPEAALTLVMLTCGPTTLTLSYHTGSHPHS